MKSFILCILILSPCLIKSFEEISIETSIKEEEDDGKLLIDLRTAIDWLNKTKVYKIKFVSTCSNIYFDKNQPYEIRSLKLDRESICPYNKTCSIVCKLIIENSNEINLIKLKVNIEDINDHQTKFRKNYYFYEYENNYLLNSSIELEQAENKDLTETNLIKEYFVQLINSTYFPFKLNYDKHNHLLQLILNETFQTNKTKETFFFYLYFIDHQNHRDSCLIQLNILNKQDYLNNPPEFQQKLYQFYYSNFNQTFIGQVSAKSLSYSNQNSIYYRLILTNENKNIFEINQTTGQIFFNKKVQFDSLNDFYQIFVEGFYSNYLSSIATVEIYLNLTQNLSDEENFIQILIPKLYQRSSLNSNANSIELFIKENHIVPASILQLFTSSSSSLKMKTSINDDYFYLKQIDQQLSELILLKTFDYEFIQNVSLKFSLNYQNQIEKTIDIFVENINDCQPEFNQTDFYFQIQENSIFPFILSKFQAFDQDFLSSMTYSIQAQDNQTFFINSTTGDLWILKSFDRETKSSYSLLVCAFDEIYETCSNILIDILDENDNICYFNSSSITLNVDENLLPNINLIQIQAFDIDYLENATLFYYLSPSTPYLTINAKDGWIQTTNLSFDYEFIQTYSALVVACDNMYSSPSFCCYLQLVLNINDIDDNLPYLIYPPPKQNLFTIDYTNKTMPRLKAFDNDIKAENRPISYSIIGGTLNSSIIIDYHSGQLNLLSTSKLPLYGTLLVSISSKTNVLLTVLVHDNQTDPEEFLLSIQRSSFLYQIFYFVSIAFLFLLTTFFIMFCLFKHKRKQKQTQIQEHYHDPLMNTPSTTTISNRSLSNSNQKKAYETYYSFGDSVHSDVIHL